MRSIAIVLIVFVVGHCAMAQSSGWAIGAEQDVLPYLTGGYFANVWAGKGHIRTRAILARARKPDIVVPGPFTNNWITAYALVGDYFLKEGWQGLWIGAGLVKWDNSIESVNNGVSTKFEHWLINGSMGYNLKLPLNFYVGAWGGLHLRASKPSKVEVGTETYHPPLLNPEGSIKVGWFIGW